MQAGPCWNCISARTIARAAARRSLVAAIRAARPTEAIDTYRAFELYTSAAAWITGEEVLAGIIPPGNRADLVIFGRDPLLAPVETLPQLEPVCTLLHGQTMFDPEGLLSSVSQGAPEVSG